MTKIRDNSVLRRYTCDKVALKHSSALSNQINSAPRRRHSGGTLPVRQAGHPFIVADLTCRFVVEVHVCSVPLPDIAGALKALLQPLDTPERVGVALLLTKLLLREL